MNASESTNEMMELFAKTKEKLNNWPLLKCSKEEQVQWFKDTIVPQIVTISSQGDRLEELLVVDELYDVANEAMENATLPQDFVQEGIPREKLEEDFQAFCKTVLVRSISSDKLVLADADHLAPEIQFIRPITFGMKVQGYVEQWDAAIGFSESLRQAGCPVQFTFTEKKVLFGISHLLNCLSAQQARTQAQAANQPLFDIDKK